MTAEQPRIVAMGHFFLDVACQILCATNFHRSEINVSVSPCLSNQLTLDTATAPYCSGASGLAPGAASNTCREAENCSMKMGTFTLITVFPNSVISDLQGRDRGAQSFEPVLQVLWSQLRTRLLIGAYNLRQSGVVVSQIHEGVVAPQCCL